MKNALLVLCAILLVSAGVSAQNFGTQTVPGLGYTPNFSTYQIDGWYCTSWTPFTADSSKIQYSNPITTAIYDSVYCSGLATAPNNGAPNFFTTIEGSFDKTNWYDSLGIAVDTTTIKLQVLKQQGKIPLFGFPFIRLKLNPAACLTQATTAANSKTDIVNFYLVFHKRWYEKQGAQP